MPSDEQRSPEPPLLKDFGQLPEIAVSRERPTWWVQRPGAAQDLACYPPSLSIISVEEPLGDMLETRERLGKEMLAIEEGQGVRRTPRPASFAETIASKLARGSPGDKKPPLAVWHPPPDDLSPGLAHPPTTAPVEMSAEAAKSTWRITRVT